MYGGAWLSIVRWSVRPFRNNWENLHLSESFDGQTDFWCTTSKRTVVNRNWAFRALSMAADCSWHAVDAGGICRANLISAWLQCHRHRMARILLSLSLCTISSNFQYSSGTIRGAENLQNVCCNEWNTLMTSFKNRRRWKPGYSITFKYCVIIVLSESYISTNITAISSLLHLRLLLI